jgi:hypothetical protein
MLDHKGTVEPGYELALENYVWTPPRNNPNESFDEFARRMAEDLEWFESPCLAAVARHYKCYIKVLVSNGDVHHYGREGHRELILGNMENTHFEPLRSRSSPFFGEPVNHEPKVNII